ncbi:MAG: HAMP domain-containing histidine kinase [Hyphomonas sp.]|nr:HAMP domain-containing histidine kinase [Hyphomonas sp.]
MLAQKQRQRLRFVHLGWLGMVAASALGILLSREPEPPMFAWMGLAAVPGLAGFLLLGRDRQLNLFAPPFLVITWTVFATFGLALGGGPLSPLVILLLIAPLVALNLGSLSMAAEAAFFAVCAYVLGLVMSRVGFLPLGEPFPGFRLAAQLLTLSALVLAGLLVWYMVHEHRRVVARAEWTPAPAVSETPKPVVPVPAGSGMLLLDVTLDGLVRALSGDRMGLEPLGVGTLFRDILAEGQAAALQQQRDGASRGDTELANGRPVAYRLEPHKTGTYIVFLDRAEDAARQAADATELATAQNHLKARTAFFASLGHDLKTPLNAIIGYADLMRHGVRGPMPEPYKDYPDIIHESGEELLLMVEDMLDLAKADADRQRLEPEPVDLAASAQSVIRQLENQAERAGVKLRLKAPVEVWAQADPRAVRQIWQNLVSNAIKYSERGGTVVLEATEEANAAVLSVTDKGAGMSEEDARKALEPFGQGGNARGLPGTGLGLAVVQRFAELHGGQVVIDSKLGKGTQVTVSLPRADEADIAPLEDAAQ